MVHHVILWKLKEGLSEQEKGGIKKYQGKFGSA